METATSNVLHRDYSRLAADYDCSRFESANGRFLARTDSKIVSELVTQTECDDIIDVPVGTGRVFEYLSDFSGTIVGCDLTPEMCAIAKSKISNSRHSVRMGDASNLPFEDGQCDCLISLRFFHLFSRTERPAFAKEFARVVRPGGWIICSFTNGWYGGGINWLRRRAGYRTVQFLHRGEVAALFPGWSVEAVRGNFLPCQWRFANRSKSCERILRWATFHTPLRSLCWEKFFLLRKPYN